MDSRDAFGGVLVGIGLLGLGVGIAVLNRQRRLRIAGILCALWGLWAIAGSAYTIAYHQSP